MLISQGNVVRVAPNELSFADPAAVRDIYMNGDVFVKETTFYVSLRLALGFRHDVHV